MLAWVESRSGVAPAGRLSGTGLIRTSIAQAKAEVQEKAEVKKAPRFPLYVVGAMELSVVSTSHPVVLRVCWWIRLLKIFGGLRSDDLQRLAPVDCKLTPEGLTALLRRTKTTGPNKRVKNGAAPHPPWEFPFRGWTG